MFKYHTLKFIIWMILLLPSLANALSLGEIKVYSNFAQPFSAEIDIPSYTSDELESLEITLAGADKFETLGLEILPYMETLIFKLEEKTNGTPFIKIFTKTPLKELSISFVIEVTWLGGRIIKDYHTLLTPEAITELREEQMMQKQLAQIDTPPTEKIKPMKQVVAEEKMAPATSTVNTVLAEAPVESSQPSAGQRSEKPSKVKNIGANGVEYTRVGSGETLSQIALKVKDDPETSMHQVMVTLFEQNPQAFINNNMNNLKAGSKLTIKDINDFKLKSKSEAYALAQQYLNTSNTKSKSETAIAKEESTPAIDDENKGNRLEIASVSEEPVPVEIMEKLKQEQIATTEEELAIAKKNGRATSA